MRTIITYIAVDGKPFDNELECQAYELSLNCFHSKLHLYDENYSPIDTKHFDSYEDDFFFIIVNTPEEIMCVKQFCDEHELATPWEFSGLSELCGLYFLENGWHHWQTEMKNMQRLGERFQQFMEMGE